MPSPIDSSSAPILVTPSDALILKYHGVSLKCRGISFAVAGDLAIKDDQDTTVIIPNGSLAAGSIHPISTQQVLATGTAATGIVAYF